MPSDFHEFLRCAGAGLAVGLLLCAPALVYRWLRGLPLFTAATTQPRGTRIYFMFGAIFFSAVAWLALAQHKPTYAVAFGIVAFVSLLLAFFRPPNTHDR